MHILSGHADIFGQPTRIQPGGPEDRALRKRSSLAKMTDHTRHMMMHKYPLPLCKLLDTLAHPDHNSHRLMSWIEWSTWPHIPLHHIAGADTTGPQLDK